MPLKPGQKSKRNIIYKCSSCGDLQAMITGEVAPICKVCAHKKLKKTPVWVETDKEILLMTRNIKKEIDKRKTKAEKISDWITDFCGSMLFVYLHVAWFGFWIVYNLDEDIAFDPYPFGLLTLIVSLEAIILATFILVSQNRQSEVFDRRSELDYQIDIKSEKNTAEIMAMLNQIHKDIKNKKKTK